MEGDTIRVFPVPVDVSRGFNPPADAIPRLDDLGFNRFFCPIASGIPTDMTWNDHFKSLYPLDPSGHLTQLWKITVSNGWINYKWQFSTAMLNYQRVHDLHMGHVPLLEDIGGEQHVQVIGLLLLHAGEPIHRQRGTWRTAGKDTTWYIWYNARVEFALADVLFAKLQVSGYGGKYAWLLFFLCLWTIWTQFGN